MRKGGEKTDRKGTRMPRVVSMDVKNHKWILFFFRRSVLSTDCEHTLLFLGEGGGEELNVISHKQSPVGAATPWSCSALQVSRRGTDSGPSLCPPRPPPLLDHEKSIVLQGDIILLPGG